MNPRHPALSRGGLPLNYRGSSAELGAYIYVTEFMMVLEGQRSLAAVSSLLALIGREYTQSAWQLPGLYAYMHMEIHVHSRGGRKKGDPYPDKEGHTCTYVQDTRNNRKIGLWDTFLYTCTYIRVQCWDNCLDTEDVIAKPNVGNLWDKSSSGHTPLCGHTRKDTWHGIMPHPAVIYNAS